MPIYEYQCKDCDNIFEQWCKYSQMEEVISCPLCAAPSNHIISNTAFVLKGSGWYATEYGNRKNISDKEEAPKKDENKEKTSDNASDTKLTSDNDKVSEQKPKLAETNSPSITAPPSQDSSKSLTSK